MADPFSILVGTAGLFDVCVRATAYLVQIKEAAGKVEEDIVALEDEIQALASVNESIKKYWRKHRSVIPVRANAEDAVQIQDTWRDVGRYLLNCQETVKKMSLLLEAIIGKAPPKGAGKLDGLLKALRKQSKVGDFEKLRRQLADYRGSLHLLLSTINL
jgi:hypothetical protein